LANANVALAYTVLTALEGETKPVSESEGAAVARAGKNGEANSPQVTKARSKIHPN
jgi:hypothetical protein